MTVRPHGRKFTRKRLHDAHIECVIKKNTDISGRKELSVLEVHITMSGSEEKILEDVLRRISGMEITGVSIDSRTIKKGELFVALKGPRFDGHGFISTAIKKGAWGALVNRDAVEKNSENLGGHKNILPVGDTLSALQKMSYLHRKKFSIPVVGITGSNGKTTTKEMLAEILTVRGAVLKNEGNLNNHIGVPLTLLRMNDTHKAAAVEMGMSAPGEIAVLARLVSPTVGVITNIGPAHLEFFESQDGIAQAKGELLDHIRPGGTAALNADDAYCGVLKKKFSGLITTFGIDTAADVRASGIRHTSEGLEFTLTAHGCSTEICLRSVGKHNVYNALAAAAASLAAGLPLDAVKHGLDNFASVAMRSEIRQLQGRTVLADYYNANPASMEAALAALVDLKRGAKTVAVLGDMLELGASSGEEHRKVGRTAARMGVDRIIVLGDYAKDILRGAVEAGMTETKVFAVKTHEEAAALLREQSRSGDAVLIKGSRGMKMEKILEEF